MEKNRCFRMVNCAATRPFQGSRLCHSLQKKHRAVSAESWKRRKKRQSFPLQLFQKRKNSNRLCSLMPLTGKQAPQRLAIWLGKDSQARAGYWSGMPAHGILPSKSSNCTGLKYNAKFGNKASKKSDWKKKNWIQIRMQAKERRLFSRKIFRCFSFAILEKDGKKQKHYKALIVSVYSCYIRKGFLGSFSYVLVGVFQGANYNGSQGCCLLRPLPDCPGSWLPVFYLAQKGQVTEPNSFFDIHVGQAKRFW